MPEFTGERVIPGLVDDNLFNEHVARFCRSGYGPAERRREPRHA